ncbi:hypothetical protein SPI_00287 [Niveomyces insectorum RCEF 264]|uniref:Uncharacterized protein n=1 Tax=Niveomyces insectorum RCEF 264 TaxID=1081102 RepID=A0A162JFD4_9HYPO|nr:hypothetical protein SPI_00287 [Niveomyces insectorum RCEF 264]
MEADDMDISDNQQVTDSLAAANGQQSGPTGTGNGTGNKAVASWNTPKHREEVEAYRSKLSDQGFNPADFGDPLSTARPLQQVYGKAFPAGTEERLKVLVSELEAQGSK